MTFQDGLRKAVHRIRAIPDRFGVRTYTVQVETKTWTGAERGEGSVTTTTTSITEADGKSPKVRWLNQEELAVGGYEHGTVEVGPITPDHPGGGTALSTLEPTLGTNDTLRYILTGPRYPSGGYFRMKELRHHRGYQYSLILDKSAD